MSEQTEVWDPHFESPREPALLVCYARGLLADRLCDLTEEQLLQHAVSELEHVFPGAHDHFQQGTSICWRKQTWIRGGWPLVRSGFAHRVAAFREPDGRVFFAGDYATSHHWLNTMEGALESGEHAARSISELT